MRASAAAVDPLSFGHHHHQSGSNSSSINSASSAYDPTRAYSEYATYYAASRLAGGGSNMNNGNGGGNCIGVDSDSLHSTLYRNGLFSAVAAVANSSDTNSMLFRVRFFSSYF